MGGDAGVRPRVPRRPPHDVGARTERDVELGDPPDRHGAVLRLHQAREDVLGDRRRQHAHQLPGDRAVGGPAARAPRVDRRGSRARRARCVRAVLRPRLRLARRGREPATPRRASRHRAPRTQPVRPLQRRPDARVRERARRCDGREGLAARAGRLSRRPGHAGRLDRDLAGHRSALRRPRGPGLRGQRAPRRCRALGRGRPARLADVRARHRRRTVRSCPSCRGSRAPRGSRIRG